jgi:hypothetical protein
MNTTTPFVLAFVLIAGTASSCMTSSTPEPRVPGPSEPVVIAIDEPIFVPPQEIRDAYANMIDERIHATDMRLYFFEADGAADRAALAAKACRVDSDRARERVDQIRREVGAARMTLSAATGTRWLDARGQLEAKYRELLDRVAVFTAAEDTNDLRRASNEGAGSLTCAAAP